MSTSYYASSIQHLLAELKRIDLLIMAEVEISRRQYSSEVNLMKMYGISENEIDMLINEAVAAIKDDAFEQPRLNGRIRAMMEQQQDDIAARKSGSAARDITLRLDRLRDLYRLTQEEVDILLISLAPEISNKYQRFFAYLQDDKNQIRPCVDLVLKLLQVARPTDCFNLSRYGLFADRAPLLRASLVYLEDDVHRPGQPLLNRIVRTDERIRDFLLGSDNPARELEDCATCLSPQHGLNDLLLRDEFKSRLVPLVSNVDLERECVVLYLQGGYGAGKQALAEGLCRHLRCNLLAVDVKSLAHLKTHEFRNKVSCSVRESELQHAAVIFNNLDLLLPGRNDDGNRDKENASNRNDELLDVLTGAITRRRGLFFLTGNAEWEPRDLPEGCSFFRIPIPNPDTQQREQLWKLMQQASPQFAHDVDLPAISDRFQLSPGQIRDALVTSASLSRLRDPDAGAIGSQDLGQACRLQSNRRLGRLAQNISTRYRWDDLVLAPGPRSMLEEIRARVTHRSLVYEHWGFDNKLAMGKGLHLLFSGPPGTGKTMAADVLANEFEMSLYKIDLSTVVSKYIGETEKNLSEIFHEGESSNAILFFDEADALFGKRSEVKDAHDRHANIEVSYLLQRMEQYAGIVILSTNFRRNMDDAFTRRLHFCVDFPLPDKPERLRIWQKIWPEKLPREASLDLEFLAERLQISGGYIRNIALGAAFLAAEEARQLQGEPEVSMEHLLKATRREYQKMGQILKQSTLSR